MKIDSRDIKQLNTTALFEDLDTASVGAKQMRKAFGVEDDQQTSYTDTLNGKKLVVFTDGEREEVSLENDRLRINDKTGKLPRQSRLVQKFRRIVSELVDEDKLTAYGFNYDVLVTTEEPVEYEPLIGDKLDFVFEENEILRGGVRVAYEKNDKRYDFQLASVGGKDKQLIAHLNVHYEGFNMSFDELNEQFKEGHQKINKMLDKLSGE